MTKEELVAEIKTYPLSHAALRGMILDGLWDENKLLFMESHDLQWLLRDIKIMERNKKLMNGED